MLIKRIKAKNFKTYLNLDLDISVEQDRPIILIGGANGGGKTTLFEAIYGALYGLHINTAKQFNELLNAGALGKEEEKILLELHFTGKVLNEEQQYVLTRTYMLNPSGNPVESVKLNMNGTIFVYGTATPPAQRAEQEAQVNKIIKANLPQELSRYFLFDAMEAGNLLKEDQLNRVIKENIENVMGFNKYMQMSKSAESLFQAYTAQRLNVEKEKLEYLQLVDEKKKHQETLANYETQLQDALQYAVSNKELYDNLKSGLNQEITIKNKIEQTKLQIENIHKKEGIYRDELDEFVKEMELNVCLPKLIEAVKSEINLILKVKSEQEQKQNSNILPEQIEAISKTIVQYLKENNLLLKEITVPELVDYVMASSTKVQTNDQYAFLEFSEVKALEGLLNTKTSNVFPSLNQQQVELNVSLNQIPMLETQIENMKAQITGRDYVLLKAYEDNENNIKKLEIAIADTKAEIVKIEKRLHQFDIQTSQEPDPKYEALGKLKLFFEDVANRLLKVKKQQIELKMKQDLNINLAAYRDVIDRVELSENLKDLTFKIFHKAGNEIYLSQLNTASKQVVIQVLLKSLHEFGDYDPPVMIDTVMGVLDETSRAIVLENYFPDLSQQTILLSSDSEIRIGKDLEKIEPFISKSFTLQRDRERQLTDVTDGYFGITLKD
ncbi:AAA family ATPase [Flavihumibacter profundi]|uniref:AAA family ATPase n=1 Tax=Flavihumibacter profundi TaxID=2716883 RepID=UPI001CC6380C|nr:AAA family ATPase [Flavihumibacter profundi]MBZ5857579.1 AAA family ATPase [Flavihumibacter profundi]